MYRIFRRFTLSVAALALVVMSATVSSAQQDVRWLRNPAISPDGSQIV